MIEIRKHVIPESAYYLGYVHRSMASPSIMNLRTSRVDIKKVLRGTTIDTNKMCHAMISSH